MRTISTRRLSHSCCVLLGVALAACGSAPVGPGYYRVTRGDTVGRIAHTHHQSVYNIARWNHLANPNAIEVGQVLRVAPPAGESRASVARRPPRARYAGASSHASRGDTASVSGAPDEKPLAPAAPISLVWPASGSIVHGFDGSTSKGIDIANVAGTPVVAAAAGVVVYAGNGLRGYGNMIIIKHKADYLSAYAHNRTLLVKEGQTVAQGQKIAEMGDSDSDRVALHFEVRYQGSSVNPVRYLPAR